MLDPMVQRTEVAEASGTTPAPLADVLADQTLSSGERLRMVEALFVHDAEGRRSAPTDRGSPPNRARPSRAGRQGGRETAHRGGA
jgi:hypothetical protein